MINLKPGDLVVYKPTDINGQVYKTQAGVVKRISECGNKAFIWYHEGCTAARTPIEYLHPSEETKAHRAIHRGCTQCMKGAK
jgi:hypothetical protein